MRALSFLLPALLAVLPAWALTPPPPTLEQTCAGADVVVLGTLGDRIGKATGESGSWISGEIRVKEVLYGRPGNALPVRWDALLPVPKDGHERIWCLRRVKDETWDITHSGAVQPVEARREVEKAIQARLAESQKILEAQPRLNAQAGEKAGITVVQSAMADLVASGPAALPGVRALLTHAKPAQRAWGCTVAGQMKDKALAGDLAALLDDDARFDKAVQDVILEDLSVSGQALEALGEIAGKPFVSKEEARAWVKGI